jgi:Xaa-Pro aminopeptidase
MTVLTRADKTLTDVLERLEPALSAADLRAFIDGVAAAPDSFEPDAWMTLIHPDPDPALKALLASLLAEQRQRMTATRADHRTPAQRLEALRRLLKRKRLAGFIVPRGDEHQGEYVAARSERLAWLTGFTGSAGSAVVLADEAALFVDGRYTVQAAAQVDAALFDIRHVTREPMAEWIAARLTAGARLGYDPWLHTPQQVAGLVSACERAAARLVPVASNPIDALWRGQPAAPIAPVFVHDGAFAGLAPAEKRERAAALLRRDGEDAVLLSQPEGVAWLLNIRGGDVPFVPVALAFAILHADSTVELFIDPRKLTRRVREHLGHEVTVSPPEGLAAALDRLGQAGARVRIDPESTPHWAELRLTRAGARLSRSCDPVQQLKAVKNEVELAGLRAAHVRDGAALCRFLAWLEQRWPAGGLSEMDAAARLASFRAANGRYRGASFPTISAAGGNGAIVHYRVTEESNRLIEPDTLYLVDSGGQYLDGTTDVTRTVAIGQPTAEMRERFTRVLKGHVAIAAARFPKGTTGSQLDVLARQALWQAGLDYDHGTGHGVGYFLAVHEGPQRVSKQCNTVALEAGMILSNEPGYYRPDAYGIRIENLVAVTPLPSPDGAERELLGFETLTLAPIDLALVDPSLLTEDEIRWLDGYHARVRDTLVPLVDADTASWLAQATRPVAV